MRNTMKRVSLVVAMVLVAGALGACADEPTGLDEQVYSVQMDEETGVCVMVDGKPYCKP